MRSARRFLRSKSAPSDEMALQITSMADIFTILLVFLLKSFSTGMSSITPSNALILPEAHASDTETEALNLEIAPNVILLDGKPVVELDSFRLSPNDVESDGTPRMLNLALVPQKKANAQQKIMILADQKTPYSTLKAVMAATTRNGFAEFQLVVVQE